MSKYNKKPVLENILDAITLIFIGVILLLNTTKVLPWSVWGSLFTLVINLWPVFLIVIGLQIIFSFNVILRSIFKILGTVVFIGFFILAILLDRGSITLFNRSSQGSSQNQTYIHNVSNDGILQATTDFKFTLVDGSYNLKSSNSSKDFLFVEGKYNKDSTEVKLSSTMSENKTDNTKDDFRKFTINFEDQKKSGFDLLNLTSGEKYDFLLDGNGTPVNLDIELVAGSLVLDTKNLILNSLNFDLVAGDADLSLSTWLTNTIDIKVTAGSLKLDLPKNANFNFKVDSLAGNVTLDGQELQSGNRTFTQDREKIIYVNIENVAGSIELKTN